ncbi:MAG: M23 family metallopeptidase [Deltaproteobacteria bacterium]|nr:M23 family metallopeptidase [Deltaproteobacteria bacterium]
MDWMIRRGARCAALLVALALASCGGDDADDVLPADAGSGGDGAVSDAARDATTPDAAAPTGHDFLLPWTGGVAFTVTQGHNTGSHVGLSSWAWDFGMAIGTPVRAAHDGTVRLARGDSRTGGCDSAFSADANHVVVDRGDGLESVYLHLDSTSMRVGQPVRRGDIVGLSGETGWACGAHLHFQIQRSPAGGGGQSRFNQTVPESFHDTGQPLDPAPGTRPVSANAR